ncbi:MAG: lytic transglycosylase domain-containing protein [Muribaculaceae bacterium]|nr:lytic transglycosylase domain-containing protein [Muribaculaceae bacterium]
MTLNHKTFLGSVAALTLLGVLAPAEDAQARTHHNDVTEASATQFAPVVSPYIPSSVRFAGETIGLDDVSMAERLDRELSAMAYTHGNTMLVIKRANRYFPQLIPILKRNGVPEDIVYLAAIESSLNPRAVSSAKAAGMWQFMPATAKEYGLEVSTEVDERYDVEKSTEAACRYLKNAYAKYGNWESVAASYNGGMGRISTELEAQQADSAYDLWLAEETMRYPFRMLAMKMILETPADYGFHLTADNLYQPFEYETVSVSGPVADWPQWAIDNGTDYRTLREHNPWIRSKQLTNKAGKTYKVKIPKRDSLSRSKQKTVVYNSAWTGK